MIRLIMKALFLALIAVALVAAGLHEWPVMVMSFVGVLALSMALGVEP